MATAGLTFPSDDQLELVNRFTANKNYLCALAAFLSHEYGQQDRIYSGLAAALSTHKPQLRIVRAPAPLAELRRWLLLSWTSEMQLLLPAELDESTLGYANAWAPVHAYYAVYGTLQAWFLANGMTGVTNDHTGTLKSISNVLRERRLLPAPWCLLAVGCPMQGERVYVNQPPDTDCASKVQVLSTPGMQMGDPEFWPRYATWLRTTREARLRARESEWKEKSGRKRIDPAVRLRFAKQLAPTSLFDCFWRLRVKSNYGAVDVYLVEFIPAADHKLFNKALQVVTRATVAALELSLMRRVGPRAFVGIATDFVARDTSGLATKTVGARLAAYGVDRRSSSL